MSAAEDVAGGLQRSRWQRAGGAASPDICGRPLLGSDDYVSPALSESSALPLPVQAPPGQGVATYRFLGSRRVE